jgi:hypothetical protein
MNQAKTFWLAFWSGLAAPGMLFGQTPEIPRIRALSDTSRNAMRSDWVKIGEDFNRVITREQDR